MGLGDVNLLDDGDGKVSAASVSCSICLDLVIDNGDRSLAKLQCGHQFHLDCIGSAFNVKGAMQCPNCRKVEKGLWLYANGSHLLPELGTDDWVHDEDLYDLGYSEMSFGVHWCPYSGLTRLPSSFDEGEFSSTPYHDLLGRHAGVAERTTLPSATHPCPYIAYIGPIHPSSSASNASVSDVPSFNGHWNGPSVPSEVSNPSTFHSLDVRYHSWDQSSPFDTNNHIGAADQSVQSIPQRTTRNGSDIPRPGMPPFVVGHRAPSSSAALLPYPGIGARPRNHATVQAQLQQPSSNPVARTPGGWRSSSSHRGGMAQVAPLAPPSLDHHPGFYFFSSENPHHDHANSWDRRQQHQPPPFTFGQLDRDSIWGPFRPLSDSGIRLSSNIRQGHGSERMPSQNWLS